MKVSTTNPAPKKTLSISAMAVSVLMREARTTLTMATAASQPVKAAPIIRTSGARLPVIRKASATPGRAACDIASPSRACRRSTAKAPRAPLTIPRAAEPSATVRSV